MQFCHLKTQTLKPKTSNLNPMMAMRTENQ